MRSNLWASGYDVDGTDQTSLGQFSGRVQQTYKHSVPRFFVPEHRTMFTLALVRFPPTATKEIQYLNAKGALTYPFFSSRSRHTRFDCHWSSDVCSSDLTLSPARRRTLELERDANLAIADDAMSSEGARRMAAERAKAIAKLLALPDTPA